jgi:hypothetical protein
LQSAIIQGYPSIGIHATHMGMTKFETNNDAGFVAVIGELRRWIRQIDTDAGAHTVKETHRETPVTTSDQSAKRTPLDDTEASIHHSRRAAAAGHRRMQRDDSANSKILHYLEMPLRDSTDSECLLYVAHVQGYPGYVKVGLAATLSRLTINSRAQGLTLSDIHTYQTLRYIGQRVEALTYHSLSSQAHRVVTQKVQSQQGVRERVQGIELYQVDLDIARHVMDRWLTLFGPETSPQLYDNEGNLIEFWHKRAKEIANSARGTEGTFDSHTRLWDALLFSPTTIESYLQPQQ